MEHLLLTSKSQPKHVNVHEPASYARPRILCATDLATRSDPALRRTLRLCESLDGHALLLNVVESDLPIRLAGRRMERAQAALEWQTRRASNLRTRPELLVRIGRPHETIARVARECNADLIVIGRHQRRRIDHVAGCTAERIARRSGRPVLVANTDSDKDYNGVTFLARNNVESYVQAASRFELFDTAHVLIAPPLARRDGLPQWIAALTRSRLPGMSERMQRQLHRRCVQALTAAGLHHMGFEIVSDRPTPRALLNRIRHSGGPQLLIAGVDRFCLWTRSLPRTTALLALRSQACDVLIASDAAVRRMRRSDKLRWSEGLVESASY